MEVLISKTESREFTNPPSISWLQILISVFNKPIQRCRPYTSGTSCYWTLLIWDQLPWYEILNLPIIIHSSVLFWCQETRQSWQITFIPTVKNVHTVIVDHVLRMNHSGKIGCLPNKKNSTCKKQLYKKFWLILSHQGLWSDAEYVMQKQEILFGTAKDMYA